MPRRQKGRVSRVGPRVQTVTALYVQDQSTSSERRSNEVLTLISQVILLSHKRGRPKKEEEVNYAA